MSNTVYDVDFTRALPAPLKNDAKMLALGRAIAGELQENIRLARLAIIYPLIDELPEWLLDILAWDLHVDWYDDSHPIDTKRAVIKDSVRVHRRMATKFAVITALGSVFPQSGVLEWFEYGGTHHRFRIILDLRESEVSADLAEIRRVIITFNRLTAHLDAIILRFKVDKTPIIAAGILKHTIQHTTTPQERGETRIQEINPTPIVQAGTTIHTIQHTAIPTNTAIGTLMFLEVEGAGRVPGHLEVDDAVRRGFVKIITEGD